jgi:hypothetical protein
MYLKLDVSLVRSWDIFPINVLKGKERRKHHAHATNMEEPHLGR